jgi:hypothetical protein
LLSPEYETVSAWLPADSELAGIVMVAEPLDREAAEEA